MSTSIFTSVLDLSDATFAVIDDDEWPPEDAPDQSNGLVCSMSRGALISTGIHTGVINIQVQALDQPPATLDLDDWDDVIEISFPAPAGRARVVAMEDIPEDSPLVTRAGPGTYRLRVHAKGRDTDPDGVAFEPFETYLLTIWPAPVAAETIYKATDSVGQERREFAPAGDSTPSTGGVGWSIVEDIQDDPDEADEWDD